VLEADSLELADKFERGKILRFKLSGRGMLRGTSSSLLIAILFARVFFSQPAKGEAEAHIGKGYELVQEDRYDQAAAEFNLALAIDPSLVKARYQLAVCLFALGRREESEVQFRRLLQETSSDPNVLYYLGRLRLLALDDDAAIPLLRKIVAAPPFPDTAFYLGCAYLGKGEIAGAISTLELAATSAPRDFRIPYRLARAYQQAGRSKEAEKEYQRSSELREHYNTAARELVACAEALKNRSAGETRTVCQQMADPNDPDKLTSLGIVYGEHGAYDEAIGPLRRAAELDPDSFEIFHNLGLSYFRLRQYAGARQALERAVELRRDFFGSNALLGAVYFTLKSDELAYPVLVHAHELKPDDGESADLLFKVAMLLARDRFLEKDYLHTGEYLRKAAEVQPTDPSVHRRLAEVYGLLGQETLAAQEAAKADQIVKPPK
jgi:tetratricopeptide (TPR) repeat protein